jgi:hypothetical protein
MLRYGLTDDAELGLIGSGLMSVYDPGKTVVGFAPLILAVDQTAEPCSTQFRLAFAF